MKCHYLVQWKIFSARYCPTVGLDYLSWNMGKILIGQILLQMFCKEIFASLQLNTVELCHNLLFLLQEMYCRSEGDGCFVVCAFNHKRTSENCLAKLSHFFFLKEPTPYLVKPGDCGSAFWRPQQPELFQSANCCHQRQERILYFLPSSIYLSFKS